MVCFISDVIVYDAGVKSPFGAKPKQICVFASKLVTTHIVSVGAKHHFDPDIIL